MKRERMVQYALLHADPAKVGNAFEEGIRMDSPAMVLVRTATCEVQLSGLRLRRDTKIGYYPGAADRDPRKWTDPDRYDITRDVAGVPRAFGVGAHVCIRQMIARLEAECVSGAIARREKSIELAGAPQPRLVNTLHTLDALPLRIIPA